MEVTQVETFGGLAGLAVTLAGLAGLAVTLAGLAVTLAGLAVYLRWNSARLCFKDKPFHEHVKQS